MNEALLARIVADRYQHMPVAFILILAASILGLTLAAFKGITVVVGTLVLCVAIYAIARRLRRSAIQRLAGLLEHGARFDARVVQARRVSMTQLRVSVHVNGPITPFSELISSNLDEAAFINRAVVVVCDRANPAWYVLVPNW